MTPPPPGVVLYVEDQPEQRESLATVLRLCGFRPHGVGSARAAVETAAMLGDLLDVLIVDYHLDTGLGDDDTGTDVAESIARTLGHSVPTVILTGDPANAQFPLLTDAPIWLVRKPADTEVLVAALPALVAFNRAVCRVRSGAENPVR
jgi:CheY-like chemotaxis protein